MLEGFGYSRKNVISMVKKHPSILNYSDERINGRINDMVGLGIEYKDVLNILLVNPSLFGNDMETITDKKIFYDSLNLFSVFVKSPKELMQGIAKSYARYMYYCSIGIDIYATENGYKRLFIGEERFKNRYGVETDELIKQYDVDKYLESVKSKKIKRV